MLHKHGFGAPWAALGRSLGSLGAPLGSLTELWDGSLGSLGGPQGWVACRGESLVDLGGGANRQPVPLDAYSLRELVRTHVILTPGAC